MLASEKGSVAVVEALLARHALVDVQNTVRSFDDCVNELIDIC